ncbi:MAG TPA: hypothetical protein VJY62_08095 [Bacteroidia bacterium]|nr:hypothetical protein [Bacteroidia bacterium]
MEKTLLATFAQINFMNFLRAKTTWTNIEFAIIKVSLISYGIIIGIYFTTFLKNYILWLWLLFGITITWFILLWVNKMKKRNVKI